MHNVSLNKNIYSKHLRKQNGSRYIFKKKTSFFSLQVQITINNQGIVLGELNLH